MEARKVLWLVRKWLWLIVLACLIGGAVGLVVSFLQPKTYEADTTLYLSSPNRADESSVLGAQQAAKALALIPQSNSVLVSTIQALGDRGLTPSQLSSMVTAVNNLDTQYVTIGVRDKDPKQAIRLAREIAKQSVIQFAVAATSGGQVQQFLQQELVGLENQIRDLEKQLATAQAQAGLGTPSTSTISQLNTQLIQERTLYNQLLSSYTSISSIQITVVQDAQLLPTSGVLGKALAGAMGMLAGLIAIVGVIILIEQTDDVLRTPDKISRATSLSTLMAVPYSPAIAKQALQLNDCDEDAENSPHEVTGDTDTVKIAPAMVKQARILAHISDLTGDISQDSIGLVEIPKSPHIENHQDPSEDTLTRLAVTRSDSASEVGSKVNDKALNSYQLPGEFLTLGVLLSGEGSQLTSNGSTVGSLLISSPQDNDGKTLVASHLALGLARLGVEVVLVDANLQNPGVHHIFGLSNKVGLSSMLTSSGRADPNFIYNALRKTQEPNLTILPSGPANDSPYELLSSSRMTAILNQLSDKAFVVIDSPAVLTSSASVILAKKCKGVLMVVDARHTTAANLKRSLETLTRVNMNILGIILNRTDN